MEKVIKNGLYLILPTMAIYSKEKPYSNDFKFKSKNSGFFIEETFLRADITLSFVKTLVFLMKYPNATIFKSILEPSLTIKSFRGLKKYEISLLFLLESIMEESAKIATF